MVVVPHCMGALLVATSEWCVWVGDIKVKVAVPQTLATKCVISLTSWLLSADLATIM